MDRDIIISIKTILITLGIGLAAFVIYRLGPIIGVLFIALLLVIALEPAVKYLQTKKLFNKKIQRNAAVIIIYVLAALIIVLAVTLVLPPVVAQLQNLFKVITSLSEKYNIGEDLGISLKTLFPDSPDGSSGILTSVKSIFSSFTTLSSLFVISVYISLDWLNIKERFLSLFPAHLEGIVEDSICDIEENVGKWVKGELILMLSIGVTSFFGLMLIGVKYSLALGLVAGLLEIVPILGPLISAVVAGIIAFADAPIKGFAAVILFIIIQQLENNFLVPKVMGDVSGFSPLIILIALLIGTEFFGIVGAIVAVPVMMILTVVLKRVLTYQD